MTDNSTENTGKISRGESDSELSSVAVFRFRGSEDIFIHLFNNVFESDEFNDGVRNLSSPQGSESFVESIGSNFSVDLSHGGDHMGGVGSWLRSLHLNFNAFPRA